MISDRATQQMLYLVKNAADVSIRLFSWKIESEEDRQAAIKDVKKLHGYIDDVVEALEISKV